MRGRKSEAPYKEEVGAACQHGIKGHPVKAASGAALTLSVTATRPIPGIIHTATIDAIVEILARAWHRRAMVAVGRVGVVGVQLEVHGQVACTARAALTAVKLGTLIDVLDPGWQLWGQGRVGAVAAVGNARHRGGKGVLLTRHVRAHGHRVLRLPYTGVLATVPVLA